MPNQKQEIIKAYKSRETTETFDEDRDRYEFQKYKHKIEADFLKRTIGLLKRKNIKVLDVACGTGRMLPEVSSIRKEIEYFGLDTSKEMIELLKRKSKTLGIKNSIKIKKNRIMEEY